MSERLQVTFRPAARPFSHGDHDLRVYVGAAHMALGIGVRGHAPGSAHVIVTSNLATVAYCPRCGQTSFVFAERSTRRAVSDFRGSHDPSCEAVRRLAEVRGVMES